MSKTLNEIIAVHAIVDSETQYCKTEQLQLDVHLYGVTDSLTT
jgi:hypothetical protein